MADPGFPIGGLQAVWGVLTPNVGAFQQKCMQNERIGSHGGGHMLVVPPGSANDKQYSSNV